MSAWFTRHLQTCIGSLGRLAAQRVSTVMTILVVGITLALPACLQVLIVNARAASGDLTRAVDLSVYLKAGTALAPAEQVVARIRQRRDVTAVRLIKADDALKEFRQRSGFGAALDALTDNPLPHTLVIQPNPNFATGSQLETLAEELKALPEVDLVQLDTAWVDRFNAMLEAMRRIVLVIASLLGFGVIVIIGNSIRSEIQTRRSEIEITKLVGGSDAFIRRPFLYAGVWYGLGGGLIALLISYLFVALLALPIQRLATLYGSNFALVTLDFPQSAFLLGLGIGLGWFGSLLAATRHLRRIEP